MTKGIGIWLSVLLVSIVAIAKEPRNLDLIKKDLIRYHDSGEYMLDISNDIKHALSYVQLRLDQQAVSKNKKKLAIILDIDETSLSNYQDLVNGNFGLNPQDFMRLEDEAHDPAIGPTLQLYRFAKSHGIAVFFLTGRVEKERDATLKNLQAVGYQDWDGLILRPVGYEHTPASVYKTAMRKNIVAQGYDIILNVGDQKSDLVGGYADKSFKLANPYYLIP